MDLSQITTGATIKPPTIFLYGVEGIGKTTFAAHAPSPVFIPTEDGLGVLPAARFPLAKKYSDVVDAITTLSNEKHEFKTAVIDSADWLEQLIWAQVNVKYSQQEQAYGKGQVFAADYMKRILNGLTYLRDTKGMTVILLGHAQVKHFKSPEVDDFDRYMSKLQERTSALVREWCDCLLFANYEIFSHDGKGAFNGKRYLFTTEAPGHLAKNRFGLEDRIELSWSAFSDAISSSFNKQA